MKRPDPKTAVITKAIEQGLLVSAEIVASYMPPTKGYAISPALLLTFSAPILPHRKNVYPVRKEFWAQYKPLIPFEIKDTRQNPCGLYFADIKVPKSGKNADGYYWAHVYTNAEGKAYYVHTSGIVAVRYKHGKERILTPYLHNGKLCVKVDKLRPIKHLVAAAALSGYRKGMPVIQRDRNPLNCDYKNLVLIPPEKLGAVTGHLAGKAKPVRAYVEGSWKTFRSVRQCAIAIHCSYQTVLDYINGAVKNSVCEGIVLR